MEGVTFVCRECGCDRIQEPAWVEMNTEFVVGTGNEGPGHAGNTYCYWCPDCAERGAGPDGDGHYVGNPASRIP